ncbi:hypothetical protein AAFF_G00188450 [Aldrovandia affinis]|uniref:EF-hand domain-containing protein n=1 Tax=Aldrovandia affinis TaxID=143900 RepID=A0AAD7SY96_9TELE|nr:hypothetical protein AAFF_G00188450 [Aldrovandia affinis]
MQPPGIRVSQGGARYVSAAVSANRGHPQGGHPQRSSYPIKGLLLSEAEGVRRLDSALGVAIPSVASTHRPELLPPSLHATDALRHRLRDGQEGLTRARELHTLLQEHTRQAPAGNMGAHGSNMDDILAEDMHHWYNKFTKGSASGLITLFELKAMLCLTGMTEEANSYVDKVFYTFDMDGDGYIDFVEYIAAVSLLLKGEINQKLKWYFKLFDQDGNGKIDRDEMETIFKAIQDITRSHEIPPQEIVSLIYEKIDVNGEGELTLEEFISGAKEHKDIMEMLTKMMDLSKVLVIIVKGRRNSM